MTDIRRRTLLAIGGAVVATAAIAVTAATLAGAEDKQTPVPYIEAADKAPDGWRWESYGAVQLLVPTTWTYGGNPSQWCVMRSGAKPQPFVTRPGISTLAGCGEVPDPAHRTSYVAFDDGGGAGVKRFDRGWVRETRVLGGTPVTIFSDDAELRSRIFASVKPIAGTDVFGCTPNHPSTADRTVRPVSQGGLDSIGDVGRVSVCGYSLTDQRGGRLYTGRTFTGSAAVDLVTALRNATAGIGPNARPDQCVPGELGERLYVLRVHGSAHDQDVIVRYSGCEQNGTDDGVTKRMLTRDVFRALFTGADRNGGTGSPEIGEWMR